jgi:hypothetical protein
MLDTDSSTRRPPPALSTHDARDRTRPLLAAGVLAGPLFVGTVLAQAATRDGFDPSRHPLSMLALGPLGWIQTVNFLTAGLLVAASAVGMRRALAGSRGGTWGPRLIAVYGVGLFWAGIFTTDPAAGFPPGALTAHTWHGTLHNVGPTLIGLALDIGCLVFARRFFNLRQRGWAAYCLATLAADIATAAVGGVTGDYRWLLLGGALTWGWASLITARILTRHPR